MFYHCCRGREEIERVSQKDKYIVVELYRSEEEKVNMMYWY
ncbi:MAG: hypothetical protein ABIG09_05130 [bacterium]